MAETGIIADAEIALDLFKAEQIGEEVLEGKRTYSDITDDQGHQYVDLVQQGGGVLGVALVGYTMVLERAGLRFFNIAGASAGGINVMALASSGAPSELRSEKVLDLLERKDLSEIVDGPAPVPSIADYWIREKKGVGSLNWSKILFNPIDSFQNLVGGVTDKFGVNPGDNFHEWMRSEIGADTTLAGLRERLSTQGLGLRYRGEALEEDPRIALVTTELRTRSKVEFPAMADLFWENPEKVHPADFVRASMAVPMFFEPFRVQGIPGAGEPNSQWKERLWYQGDVPEDAIFVDGGMVSNFPIDIFHRSDGGKPRKPTLGARLTSLREKPKEVENLSGYAGALISSMRHDFDIHYLMENEELRHLICDIEAGDQVDWLNFYMDDEQKKGLFKLGAEKAVEFLESFDWEGYKAMR